MYVESRLTPELSIKKRQVLVPFETLWIYLWGQNITGPYSQEDASAVVYFHRRTRDKDLRYSNPKPSLGDRLRHHAVFSCASLFVPDEVRNQLCQQEQDVANCSCAVTIICKLEVHGRDARAISNRD
uniref:Uncharacterized protein n=1 Tax=Angiostrongylus cantonensis TaxID=6313 RepID=A0A158P982_ANGCA